MKDNIDISEKFSSRLELYTLLGKGLQNIADNRVQSFDSALSEIRKEFKL